MSNAVATRPALPEGLLRAFRKPGGSRIRGKWDVYERGWGYVPDEGPFILASNHIGWLDGPLLVATAPRPVHALVKSESFEGLQGAFLRRIGQVRIRRQGVDAGAIRTALGALGHGQGILVFPEGTRGDGDVTSIYPGIGYLAIVTGAPIVPVAVFGTRLAGQDRESKPEKGSRIEVHYGRSFWFAPVDPPRRRADVAEASHEIRTRLARHVQAAAEVSQVPLPGAAGPA